MSAHHTNSSKTLLDPVPVKNDKKCKKYARQLVMTSLPVHHHGNLNTKQQQEGYQNTNTTT